MLVDDLVGQLASLSLDVGRVPQEKASKKLEYKDEGMMFRHAATAVILTATFEPTPLASSAQDCCAVHLLRATVATSNGLAVVDHVWPVFR